MQKKEYMDSLKSALAGQDEELIQEIVTDYEERFHIGMEQGKSEEEIIAELGSVEDLVRELQELLNVDVVEEAKKEQQEREQKEKDRKAQEENIRKDMEATFGQMLGKVKKLVGRQSANDILAEVTERLSEYAENGYLFDKMRWGTIDVQTEKSDLEQEEENGKKEEDSWQEKTENTEEDAEENTEGNTEENTAGCQEKARNTEEGAHNWREEAENTSGEATGLESEMNALQGEMQDLEEELKELEREEEPETDRKKMEQENGQNAAEGKRDAETESGQKGMGTAAAQSDIACRKIVVNTKEANIRLIHTEDTKPTVSYNRDGTSLKNSLVFPEYAYYEGDTYYVGIKTQEKKSGFFRFANHEDIDDLEIGVPSSVVHVWARSLNGDITAECQDLQEMRLSSTSGDVCAERCKVKNGKIETVGGDVKLVGIKAGYLAASSKGGDCSAQESSFGKIALSSLSGDITAHSIRAQDSLLRSLSGDVNLEAAKVEKYMKASAVSGDVGVYRCFGKKLDASSVSGDVTVEAGMESYGLGSQSGDIWLTARADADVTAKSASGDIGIRIERTTVKHVVNGHTRSGSYRVDNKKWHGTAGIGEKKVNVSTGSGDIEIVIR